MRSGVGELNRNTQQIIKQKILIETRNSLLMQVGVYANRIYKAYKPNRRGYDQRVCKLKKPNVRKLYEALHRVRYRYIDHQTGVRDDTKMFIMHLFQSDTGIKCGNLFKKTFSKLYLQQCSLCSFNSMNTNAYTVRF